MQKGTLHAPSEPREDSDDEDDVDADIGQDRSPEEAVSNTSIGAEGALPKRRFADTTMSDHDRYESSKRSKDDGVYKEQERVRMISPSYFD